MSDQEILNTPWRPCTVYGQDIIAQSGRIVATIGPGWSSEEVAAIRALLIGAPDLLAACKNEVPQLANLAAMVDPELTTQLMEGVYAATAKVESND